MTQPGLRQPIVLCSSPPAVTEPLNDLIQLLGLLSAAQGWLLTHDHICVDVGVEYMTVISAPHLAPHPHKTVLLHEQVARQET